MTYEEKIAQRENAHKQSFLAEGKNRFADRLAIAMNGESKLSLSKKVGVSDTTIGRYLSGTQVPHLDTLESIAAALGYEVGWLASGKGPQKPSDKGWDDCAAGTSAISKLDISTADDFVTVHDFSNVEAAAGGGSYITNEETTGRMAFRREWIEREGLRAHALRVIRARGDSMEPTIQDGAPILLEAFAYEDNNGNLRYLYSSNTPREVVKRDGVYVIRLDDKLLVKRLQLDMLGGLLVKSDNQNYDTLHIPASQIEEIAVIGRVVWTGRKL